MKTRVVVDASYILSWLMPDENHPKTRVGQKVAPTLLPYEVTNALRSAVVRGRINEELAQGLLGEFLSWQIEYQAVDSNKVLQIAIEHKLSGYDANYLYLAKKMKCALLTWDEKLKKLV
jgi:predicted nucleic acid-binding protein